MHMLHVLLPKIIGFLSWELWLVLSCNTKGL